ncbi:MAG: DUF2125 domain-containing protein [Acetobacteraceae bacterium]|nr:DUF2125 domain-containing protein [Acetobacteraceae bacterium]
MRRRPWLLLATLLVLLLLGATLYWRAMSQQLGAGFDAWVADQRASGWTVTFSKPVAGGWPVAATLLIHKADIAAGQPVIPERLRWSADVVVLRISLLHPRRLEISAEGSQILQLGDGPEIPLTAASEQMVLPLKRGEPLQTLSLAADNLRAEVPGSAGTALAIARLRGEADLNPASAQGEPAVSASLTAAEINLPAQVKWPFGPRVAELAIEAGLNGLLPHSGTVIEAANEWRDNGGSLEIRHLQLVWGPLNLTGTATLALDPQLQPMGAGTAHVVGYAETLDALAAGGQISHSAATAAKAVLSLLAQSSDNGGPSEVEVPLALQYRTLSMRQVPIVRLPELDWPPR